MSVVSLCVYVVCVGCQDFGALSIAWGDEVFRLRSVLIFGVDLAFLGHCDSVLSLKGKQGWPL